MDNNIALVANCYQQQSWCWRWTIGWPLTSVRKFWCYVLYLNIKVAGDDIAFKLAIFKLSLHLNDNTGFCSIIQASKLVFGSLLAKEFWTKKFASSRMANFGSGLPAEWPFRNQNAIDASDLPLPGDLWVKRLITHALCSLAYSDIAWCNLFFWFWPWKVFIWYFCLQNTTWCIDWLVHPYPRNWHWNNLADTSGPNF